MSVYIDAVGINIQPMKYQQEFSKFVFGARVAK